MWIELAKAITELGILVVVAGIFLWFTIRSREQQESMFKKLFDNLLKQMEKCSGGHVLSEEEDQIAKKIDNNVNNALQTAVSDLNANRIMVVRFHNGGKDMNAIPFLKFSVSNESVSRGSHPLMPLFQNQFRSLIAYPIRELDMTGKCIVTNLQELEDKDFGTYELFKSYDARSFYGYALRNTNGYIFGAIAVFYEYSNPTKENVDDVEHYMNILSGQVAALLTMKEE